MYKSGSKTSDSWKKLLSSVSVVLTCIDTAQNMQTKLANSLGPDQTAPGRFDLGLLCLPYETVWSGATQFAMTYLSEN